MTTKSSPEVYFHVGLGKTGTTYLQYRFFPKLKGTHYIQRTQYRRAKQIIASKAQPRYFVSFECDQQLEDEVKWFAATFPDTHAIIVFRRHDSWIASQYRRFVKNGFRKPFHQFFDLDHDQGKFKKADLDYFSKIKLLEKYFTKQPLILFYEDMRKDEFAYMNKIAQFTQTTYDPKTINLKATHKSYNEQQLKTIYALGKYINLEYRRGFDNLILHLAFRASHNIIRYSTLYIGLALPKSMFSPESITPPSYMKRIRDHYTADWEKCRAYAAKHNLV